MKKTSDEQLVLQLDPNAVSPKTKARLLYMRKVARPWLLNLALLIVCVVMLYPIISTTILSLKPPEEVRRKPPVFLPCDNPTQSFALGACRFSLEGYARIFLLRPDPASMFGFVVTGRLFSQYLPNTLFYATAAAIGTTLFSGMAAYVLSRYRFRGRQFFLVGILALAGVPLLTMLLALYQMNINLRRLLPGYDERWFMVIVYIGFELPFAIWVVKGFFDTIPRELEEAAKIDGCTPLGALLWIVAPLAAPGLASIFLLAYVNVWNEFIANYLLMSKATLRGAMYGVYDYIAQSLTSYNALAAACIIVMLPVIVVFLLTRNVFFRSMLEGALKG
ncbi:MAG: carbohydrate ABC transporter permease [Chloroflexi bacterium]|nr:carbohydrate ABC transporter permease [Chloroflexota bacterium]